METAQLQQQNILRFRRSIQNLPQQTRKPSITQVLLNHFESNHVITTKSGLVKTLKYYYNHELALIDKPCHVHDIIPTSFMYPKNYSDCMPTATISNIRILLKSSTKYRRKITIKRKCRRNTVIKTCGSLNRNLTVRGKELFSPITSKKLKAFSSLSL